LSVTRAAKCTLPSQGWQEFHEEFWGLLLEFDFIKLNYVNSFKWIVKTLFYFETYHIPFDCFWGAVSVSCQLDHITAGVLMLMGPVSCDQTK